MSEPAIDVFAACQLPRLAPRQKSVSATIAFDGSRRFWPWRHAVRGRRRSSAGADLIRHRGAARLLRGFRTALCKAGARAVLTYDYRGLPGSPAPKGWNKRIGMKDWAVLDMPAAAAALDAVAPGHAMAGVGQSYGGQALGLCGISRRFTRYGMVATMSGYHRGLDDRWAWPRMFLVGVPVASLLGRVPRWLGIGEPIPASVFRDWARWCRRPDYFFGDPAVPETAALPR